MKCIARYKDGLIIDSTTRDYEVTMDAAPPLGRKKGMTPGELLLNALAGCKIMSLVSLVKKAGINIEGVTLELTGEVGLMNSEDVGKEFKKIHTIYNIKASDSKEKIEELIMKSDKVCTVGNSLKDSIEKTYEINLI